MTMYRSCLLLLTGFGLLGRDGGVDALPAIGCYEYSGSHYLSVPSGYSDCTKVASAIEKLPGVNTDIYCVRRRIPCARGEIRNWATTVLIAVLALLDFVLLTCMRWHTHTHTHTHSLSLSLSWHCMRLHLGCSPLCTAAAGKRNDDDGDGGMGNDGGLFTLACTAVFADWNPRRIHP